MNRSVYNTHTHRDTRQTRTRNERCSDIGIAHESFTTECFLFIFNSVIRQIFLFCFAFTSNNKNDYHRELIEKCDRRILYKDRLDRECSLALSLSKRKEERSMFAWAVATLVYMFAHVCVCVTAEFGVYFQKMARKHMNNNNNK